MSDLTYTTYVTRLANMFPISSADPNFNTFLPENINYAEQRIYRELDLLNAQVTDTTQLSSGVRLYNLPTLVGTYITVDQANLITPANVFSSLGTRVPLMAVAPEYIDMVYPSAQTATGQPVYFGRRNDTQIILGPSPDKNYYMEFIGVQRPTPLSANNPSTILTEYVPDLFMAACCVHAYSYMKDFGATTDNPQGAVSWEQQYKTLFASAQVEQARAKFHSQGWTSKQPMPVATPQRV